MYSVARHCATIRSGGSRGSADTKALRAPSGSDLLMTERKLTREEIRGHLELLLLSVLAERKAHGYDIIRELRARTDGVFDLAEGTIYPALRRLEMDGFLDSEWDSSSGRRRRVYELSDAGRTELAERRRDWMRFAGAMARVVAETP